MYFMLRHTVYNKKCSQTVFECFFFVLICRRLDYGRPSVPVEVDRACADSAQPPPAQVHAGEVHLRLLQH